MATKRRRRAGSRSDGDSESASIASIGAGSSISVAHAIRKFTSFSRVIITILLPVVSIFICRMLYSSIVDVKTDVPYVRRRGLVETDISFRQVLNENMKTSDNSSQPRNFKNPMLAYITPWNSQGYEMANRFVNKFTHLSPVWYEIKSKGAGFILEGRDNSDKAWMRETRRISNSKIKILPRILLEAFPMQLLRKKRHRDEVIDLIVSECLVMQYDGIVLESWSRWAAYGVLHDPDMRIMALEFIRQLGHALHANKMEGSNNANLELIYVISPPRSSKFEEYDFGPKDLKSLSNHVDGFSLMTYDFSNPQSPGPNAPLKWIKSTLTLLLDDHPNKLAQKVFIGLNFYGKDFVSSGGLGGGPIIGREYLSLLEKHRPKLHWENNSGEHFFLYVDDQNMEHVVFYPSLMSVSLRLQEALLWEAGISIWEIGQGLPFFFDLL